MSTETTTMEQLDRLAWDAITGWHEAAPGPLPGDGVDRAITFRSLLWDKVGRAVRIEYGLGDLDFEMRTWRQCLPDLTVGRALWEQPMSGKCDISGHYLRDSSNDAQTSGRRRPLIYFAVPSPVVIPIASRLAENACFDLLRPCGDVAGFECVPQAPYPKSVSRADDVFVAGLCHRAAEGLAELGIRLLDEDCFLLAEEVQREEQRLQRIIRELSVARPNCIVMHADNHPPFIQYAQVAKALGIPTILIQHGMDCEPYYLADAYADYLFVWGKGRRKRYLRDSHPPVTAEQVFLTGNPRMVLRPESTPPSDTVSTVLWVTRPHTSEKCYSPSRLPSEGIDLFQGLVRATARAGCRLVVKPHPADYLREYQLMAAALPESISIIDAPLSEVLGEVDAVVTEDSTAGLDALLLDKPLVHAHFADSPPVIPFAAFDAALPAFSPEQLEASLYRLGTGEFCSEHMWEGRRALIAEHLCQAGATALDSIEQGIMSLIHGGDAYE